MSSHFALLLSRDYLAVVTDREEKRTKELRKMEDDRCVNRSAGRILCNAAYLISTNIWLRACSIISTFTTFTCPFRLR